MDDVKELYVNIAFRSGRTRDIVTSTGKVKLDLLNKKAGDSITFSIDLPKIALRPGVYETYYWLGDSRAESPFDVVDNLMPPLIINTPLGINPLMISGYFDIPFYFNQSEI